MPRPPKYRFEQFFSTRRIAPVAVFSPDGRSIAYVANDTGTFNLYRQELAGGEPVQLTDSRQRTPLSVQWALDGYLYFLSDIDGNEQSDLYRIPETGGQVEQLTDRPEVQYGYGYLGDQSLILSRDGAALYYPGNAITPTEIHIFRRDLRTGDERLLCGGGPGFWAPGFESPDGRYLTVSQGFTGSDTHLHLYDTQTGTIRDLTAGRPQAHRALGPWHPDGSGFYYVAAETGEFTHGYFYHLDSGSSDPVMTPAWDTALFGTRDGRVVGWEVNEHGFTKVRLLNTDLGQTVSAPEVLQNGVFACAALSPDGTKFAAVLTQPDSPANLWVWDRTTDSTIRLTNCLGEGIDPADLVVPTITSIPGPDHAIPALLYRPRGVEPGAKVPVLLSFHGGPEAQEFPGWRAFYQYLLDRGIAVLAPNIRGSTGYGKSYQRLIYRDWGGGDLRDMEACAQWAQAQPWADPTKLAVYGASYGGFASLSCATRLPQFWRCAVDICGVANLVTTILSGPPTWRAVDKVLIGDPEEEREFLLSRSPVSYLDQVRCPLLVIQGALDPRVPKAEADQIVSGLQARGVPVEYLLFADEGHGITKQANWEKTYRVTAEFLLQHLS